MTAAQAQAPQQSLIVRMANQYGLEPNKFYATLEKTILPTGKQASQEQVAAFLVVANHYQLNPFIKEIFAFPSQGGGISPIVSVDGWLTLINRQPNLDGIEYQDHLDSDGKLTAITCRIYRKDRSRPNEITEYMGECKRKTSTWDQWPARMLRHKALIQCARQAFGFAGIYDPDEAERIAESTENGNGHIAAKTKASIDNLREKLEPTETAEVTHVDAEIVEEDPQTVTEEEAQEIAENVVSNLVTAPDVEVTQDGDEFTFETKPVDPAESKAVDLLAAVSEKYADARKNDRDLLKKMNEFVGGGRSLKDLTADELTAFNDTFTS